MSENNSGAEQGALPPGRVAEHRASVGTPVQLAQIVGGILQQQQQPPVTQTQLSTSSSNLYTKIINISNIRNANITNPSIVSALTKPRATATNIRTQLFPAVTTTTSSATSTSSSTSVSTIQSSSTPTQDVGQAIVVAGATTPRKRSRPDELPPGCENLTGTRAKVMEHKWARSWCIKESYNESVAENYFLETGGTMMDYFIWRKRPRTAHYEVYLKHHQLEAPQNEVATETPEQQRTTSTTSTSSTSTSTSLNTSTSTSTSTSTATTTIVKEVPKQQTPQTGPIHTLPTVTTTTSTIVASTTSVVATITTATTTITTHTKTSISATSQPSSSSSNSNSNSSSSAMSVTNSVSSPRPGTTPQTTGVAQSMNKSRSIGAAFPSSTTNQEQIVEKAKQEAYVMQRVTELQREGLWTERRLPKVQEAQRCKSHWDYLLEEMVWLAADFAQERKWKKAAAKKCARMVQKYFQDKATAAQKAEKAQELQLKRIASFIAKEIKTFWSSVEKLVEFKQQTRLEEKRKQALDQHLSFIVDQTEKYSQLLAEGMNKSINDSQTANSSRVPSPTGGGGAASDDEFKPDNQSDSDDEETIAQAEAAAADEPDKQSEEIAALQRESQMELEDFLNELPKDYLENREKMMLSDSGGGGAGASASASCSVEAASSDNSSDSDDDNDNDNDSDNKTRKKDKDFKVASDEGETDDENTIMEQEKAEGNVDHKQELDDLQAENEMSIEELRKKYLNLPPPQEDDSDDSDVETSEQDEDNEDSDDNDQNESSSVENSEAEESGSEMDTKQESDDDEDKLGLKMLVEDEHEQNSNSNSNSSKDNKNDDDHLINDVAALAESIQPKGNTLNTTSVVTPIPFLLKHSLREYQHIGLDWLVTMYERKLNGILADEMGLGKTIQTIALLAHLACEKGDWGPHLIIVPTSVMLNWEMECKKWCPGFKILTYYGTQKERKLKRIGWTKPNAFHICITSYKLVIQDHQSFRRKKWKYLILDEAQNIKNFKSQRWQLLLNFQTQQRLLLTGTPLQNNLMELWSLMHFLMPHVFQSHREFKEWFSNPVTGMIEGNSEYNESIIKRLHKVLRPFLLRRLKSEVEKQMPQKFEHIIMCRLSKRQRFLYDDYMSRAKTRETLATGNLLSVINVLMQLRKVCNHPNLFEVRPTVSPFQCESLHYHIPSIVYSALDYDFFKHVNLDTLYLKIINMEFTLSAYSAYRTCKYRAPKKLIEMIDDLPEAPPACPKGVVHMRVKLGEPKNAPRTTNANTNITIPAPIKTTQASKTNTTTSTTTSNVKSLVQQGVKLRVANPNDAALHGFSVHIVSHHGGGIKAIPVAALSSAGTTQTTTTTPLNIATVGPTGIIKTSGDQRVSVPTGFAQLVQSQLGKHILLTQNANLPQASVSGTTTVLTSSGQRLTVLSKPVTGVTATISGNKNVTINSLPPPPPMTPKQADVDSLLESSQAANEALATSLSLTRPLTSSLVQTFRTSNALPPINNIQTSHPVDTKPPNDSFKSNWTEKATNCRHSKLAMLHRLNEWRCHASPMYGQDLRECVTMTKRSRRPQDTWHGAYITFEQVAKREKLWEHGGVLCQIVKRPDVLVQEMEELFQRFVFCVPAVTSKAPSYRVLNPPQSKYWGEKRQEYYLMRELSPKATILHPIASAMSTQFPDPRLIQYDCGKLQTLDLLLRRLKYGGHRVLIFTQMTRMLDVLEAFLNFHGHIYLRLDGTTKVDQRQVLMERFNGNPKIFAFILSTRSGGVGVNLTGADTVIFYDSDWNPTMDAQAQDRCHRIGQTRDVHIYRLVSEKTIEENILKKANQKRMLGDLAIEGGNFTTAYFKSSTIQDLFNVDTNEDDANARMSEVLNKRPMIKEQEATAVPPSTSTGPPEDRAALGVLENALAACEDDQDVQAARTAKAEAVADLAEFDENIPLEETEKEPEMSKAEQEVQNLIKQLTPIERYAMRFVEETEAQWSAEQLAAAERQIEEQKREWEENRLAALRQEEERRTKQQEEDNDMLTFSREDATNQVRYRNKRGKFIRHNPNKNTTTQTNINVSKNKTISKLKSNTNIASSKTKTKQIKATTTTIKSNNINNKRTVNSNSNTNRRPNNRKRFNKRDSVRIDVRTRNNPTGLNSVNSSSSSSNRARRAILKPKTIEQCNVNEEQQPETPASDDEEKMDVDDTDDPLKSDDSKINSDHSELEEGEVITTTKNSKFNSTPVTINHATSDVDDEPEDESSREPSEAEAEDDTSECSDTQDSSDDSLDKKPLIPNKLDHNSPRTRSRGIVNINLWTLDVSPILPGVKPVNKVRSGTPPSKKQKNNQQIQHQQQHQHQQNKNKKQSEDKDKDSVSLSSDTQQLIEECKTTKVSVVMTDVLTNANIDVLQNNSVSSTSECQDTTNETEVETETEELNSNEHDHDVETENDEVMEATAQFKKPKSAPVKLKSRNQKSLDGWLTKIPNNANKRPATPIPNRTRRSIKSDDVLIEPPKKIKSKTDVSNGPLT